VANLAYGVFRRPAFVDLVEAWARGGELFGADYAAVVDFVGKHRVVATPTSLGYRNERPGADLIERVGLARTGTQGALEQARLYLRLNGRVSSGLGKVIAQESGRSATWVVPTVHVLRAPAWIAGIASQVRRLRSARY
jgi:hypothetical protein